MSNIYIQEPPSQGKVLLKTSVGDIDIELWPKEAPKACRNFVQLCLEGYYNNTIFHRIVKGFIAQGGDPTGTGTGGESIYGHPFKDEFHSRLRFVRRGLVAMANSGKDDNGSQFFFTLAATPELQNKHTIFGKVTGETVFNMIKLEDALVDQDDRPKYPQKIIKTEVLSNPFPDIVPRTTVKDVEVEDKKSKKKDKGKAVKNFKLLSFGEEAEEDEEETIEANQKYSGRSKSTHDILEDPTLSAQPAVEKNSSDSEDLSDDYADDSPQRTASGKDKEKIDAIRKKLKISEPEGSKSRLKRKSTTDESSRHRLKEEDEEEEEYEFGKAAREEKRRKAESIRKEIQDFKKNYQQDKKKREETVSKDKSEKTASKSEKIDPGNNPLLKEHIETEKKYKEMKSQMPKKGASRENFTLDLLEKFRKKLQRAKEKAETEKAESKDDDVNDSDDTWLAHKLEFESTTPVLAKDASTKDSDWYEISDPRSKINQKRREISKQLMKGKERQRFD